VQQRHRVLAAGLAAEWDTRLAAIKRIAESTDGTEGRPSMAGEKAVDLKG
jgi:hypothetical protein